jgi:pimeloyl-ACP methyl ester carboxylesterase
MRLVRIILRLVGIAILVPVLFLFGCQSRLIYHPRSYGSNQLETSRRIGVEAVEFLGAQGKQAAFYLPPTKGDVAEPRRIWVCFAGNGSLALDWLSIRSAWADGDGCLMVDYPGYGVCDGKPNPKSIRRNASAAVDALAAHLGMTTEQLQPQIAVLGHSIGCAAGLMLADDLEVKRIVLISPFTSMTDMGRRVLGWPLCYLNLHCFDNRHHLAEVAKRGARVSVFHGVDDEVIPIEMSRELAGSHPDAVKLIEVPDAGHNDILDIAERQIAEALK